jgi:hypothetical protein
MLRSSARIGSAGSGLNVLYPSLGFRLLDSIATTQPSAVALGLELPYSEEFERQIQGQSDAAHSWEETIIFFTALAQSSTGLLSLRVCWNGLQTCETHGSEILNGQVDNQVALGLARRRSCSELGL